MDIKKLRDIFNILILVIVAYSVVYLLSNYHPESSGIFAKFIAVDAYGGKGAYNTPLFLIFITCTFGYCSITFSQRPSYPLILCLALGCLLISGKGYIQCTRAPASLLPGYSLSLGYLDGPLNLPAGSTYDKLTAFENADQATLRQYFSANDLIAYKFANGCRQVSWYYLRVDLLVLWGIAFYIYRRLDQAENDPSAEGKILSATVEK